MSLQDIADCLKGGIGADSPPTILSKFLKTCTQAATDLKISYFLDAGLNTYQASISIRSAVIERSIDVAEVCRLAASRGFILPTNPFPVLEAANANRRIFDGLSFSDPNLLLQQAAQLSQVAAAYKEGKVTFERKPAFQLSSYEVSVDGLSPQSGDALVDILGYQPDGDFIKRKRALDSLAKLDFTKRQPYMLFTADYDEAVLIAWSKMHDASGYRISRNDVFAGVDLPDIYLENDRIKAETDRLMSDNRVYQVLSFYDWLQPDDVMMYVDRSLRPDSLYSYKISGLQKKAPGSPFIFDVPTNPLFMSPTLVDQVVAAVNEEAARYQRDPSKISPYPALADAIYGDPSLGWMLAGCNTVAAIRRDESQDSIRSLSFIGSTLDQLIAAGRAGRLVTPRDIGVVSQAVEDSMASYGISQTIISVLDGLGLTEFISGKDGVNARGVEQSTSGLGRVLSAIDPAAATLDPKLLLSSLSNPSQKVSNRLSTHIAVFQANPGVPMEEAIGEDIIDLTTQAGVGRLVQILRTVYDFYPGALS